MKKNETATVGAVTISKTKEEYAMSDSITKEKRNQTLADRLEKMARICRELPESDICGTLTNCMIHWNEIHVNSAPTVRRYADVHGLTPDYISRGDDTYPWEYRVFDDDIKVFCIMTDEEKEAWEKNEAI